LRRSTQLRRISHPDRSACQLRSQSRVGRHLCNLLRHRSHCLKRATVILIRVCRSVYRSMVTMRSVLNHLLTIPVGWSNCSSIILAIRFAPRWSLRTYYLRRPARAARGWGPIPSVPRALNGIGRPVVRTPRKVDTMPTPTRQAAQMRPRGQPTKMGALRCLQQPRRASWGARLVFGGRDTSSPKLPHPDCETDCAGLQQ